MAFLRIFGVVLLLAGPAMAYGTWQGNQQNIAVLDMMERRKLRDATDSAQYASALYHGSAAHRSEGTRWHPTGYAMLGSVTTVLGLAMLAVAFRRPRREG